jgi:hypothetical protein
VTLSFPASLAAKSGVEAAAVAAPIIFTNERRFMALVDAIGLQNLV